MYQYCPRWSWSRTFGGIISVESGFCLGATKYDPCERWIHVKPVEDISPQIGMVWKFGEQGATEREKFLVLSSSLNHDSKLQGPYLCSFGIRLQQSKPGRCCAFRVMRSTPGATKDPLCRGADAR
ncbi:hypothetical protein TNCV_4865331 [Trichonephila clavipes]|nr:hypothetical protein TNCV_4865331 [Trichonephila clavipes]